jgi:pSer/pThr/pTyr-binding forkhead associated (FHA) protein
MRIRVYLIGRHPDCDIVVNDPTVSRYHAEMVQGTDGRFYLTDRASASGTWQREGGNWVRIRQSFVGQDQPIMLGRFATSADALLRLVPPIPPTAGPTQNQPPA